VIPTFSKFGQGTHKPSDASNARRVGGLLCYASL